MRLTEAQYAAYTGGKRQRRNAIVRRSEQEEQEIVIQWARLAEAQYPCLRFLHHSPNGYQREMAVAVQIKAAGCRAGFPDLILPVPTGDYHGLFIELKAEGGRLSIDQEAWIAHLRASHYMAAVCYGADDAIRTIETYLGGS